ncbi:MAG: glycosyltransferase family 9 protein [Chloroflexota bacterium]
MVLPPLTAGWRNIRRLLVMRLDNIGDVILLGPALQAIRENLPDAHVTLMASTAGSQAAMLLPGSVDDVLPWRVLWQDLGRLPFDPDAEWRLIDRLRAGLFDAALIFTSFHQTPFPAGLACALAEIPLRVGESKERGTGELTFAVPAAPDNLHQAERNLRLLEYLGFRIRQRQLSIRLPFSARKSANDLLTVKGVPPDRPYILLAPWASCQARTYFPDRFGTAARQLAHRLGWAVVVVGRESDRPHCQEVLAPLGKCGVDLIGKTTVPEMAALVTRASLALANNTSILHIADAAQTPMVITYSGTELHSQWAPRQSPARILNKATFCSPCYAFQCPYGRECLDITPDEIVQAALACLEEAKMARVMV